MIKLIVKTSKLFIVYIIHYAILYNYFDYSAKLFSDLYLTKFLDTSETNLSLQFFNVIYNIFSYHFFFFFKQKELVKINYKKFDSKYIYKNKLSKQKFVNRIQVH